MKKIRTYTTGHGDRLDLLAYRSRENLGDILKRNPNLPNEEALTIPLTLTPGQRLKLAAFQNRGESTTTKVKPPWRTSNGGN